MNWNPYKRPDFKKQTDAELAETRKKLQEKMFASMGVNLTGALICAYVVAAALLPALLPAIPVFYGTTLIAAGILSSNRFTKLGRECRREIHDREMAMLDKRIAAMMMASSAPQPSAAAGPAPAPKPEFNGAAATVLDGDLEIKRPLQFKQKAPGATA